MYTLNMQDNRTIVEEVFSEKFVSQSEKLPSLETCGVDRITCWNKTEEGGAKLSQQDGLVTHVSDTPT